MIKIQNAKPIKEINELREQGLYNAPYSVQEAANGVKIESPDTKEIEDKIASLEATLKDVENKEVASDPYDDSPLLEKIKELEEKLAKSEETVASFVEKTDSQAKTIDELNADLDVLVGGSDE